jgi:hypothetical protein
MIEFNFDANIPKDFTGFCKILSTGSVMHMKNGKYHNENGPAIIWQDGSKFWYINGLEHREDGPSSEYVNGNKHWYYKCKNYGYNNEFTKKSWIEKVTELKYLESLKIFK